MQIQAQQIRELNQQMQQLTQDLRNVVEELRNTTADSAHYRWNGTMYSLIEMEYDMT
jgi:hypothetical protein